MNLRPRPRFHIVTAALGVLIPMGAFSRAADTAPASLWKVGQPIVTYWAGPPMTDAVASQMADGGWNLVWCGEKDLDLVRRHGLRAQLQDPLLAPASLENPVQLEKLDALIARVRQHPALYAYFITDEPNATNFPALGKLVAHLRERDPAHLAYINLFPTYATNEQLGNQGDTVTGLPGASAPIHRLRQTRTHQLRPLPVHRPRRFRPILPQPRPDPPRRPGCRLAVPQHRPGLHLDPFHARAQT